MLSLPGLNEVGESLQVLDLFLVANLLVEDDELSLDDASLGQLGVQSLLDLRSLDLLDLRRVLLQLLRDFLEYLSLLKQLNKVSARSKHHLQCPCLTQVEFWLFQGV